MSKRGLNIYRRKDGRCTYRQKRKQDETHVLLQSCPAHKTETKVIVARTSVRILKAAPCRAATRHGVFVRSSPDYAV